MALKDLATLDLRPITMESESTNESAGRVMEFPRHQSQLAAAIELTKTLPFRIYPVHSIEKGKCSCGKSSCKHPGKHPVLNNWLDIASHNEQDIRKMWRGNPNYNIGIATGKYGKNGLLVIDVDEGHKGFESLKAMQDEYEPLPDTLSVKSGGGGLHMYFSYDAESYSISGRAPFSPKFEGIDSRADRGGIVAPPSIHKSGNRYEWDGSVTKIARAPMWLLGLVSKSHSKRKVSLSNYLDGSKKIPEGERNNTLFEIGSRLRRSGRTSEELQEKLETVNQLCCEPPLEDDEVVSVVESVLSYTDSDQAKPKRKGSKVKKEITSILPFTPIDKEVLHVIRQLLDRGDQAGSDDDDDPKRTYYSHAGAVLVEWMAEKGKFIRTNALHFYYMLEENGMLYDIEVKSFKYFLYRLSGINPKDRAFEFLINDCLTAATLAEEKVVHKFTFWSEETKTLYISARNGNIFRFDGETIETIRNGEETFFLDRPDWDAIEYDPSKADGQLEKFCQTDANWEESKEEQALAFKAWIVSLFFPERCEAKPLLLLLGEAGSGKTTLLRLILRYLFGINSQVTGVPGKEDDFMASAASSSLFVIDNLDTSVSWMRDRLAMLSTGGADIKRKLYSTNEPELIDYNCYIAFTSRSPDTLKRQDLAERLLILRLAKIANSASNEASFICESVFRDKIVESRPGFWADLFQTLNAVVRTLRTPEKEGKGWLRFPEWERLGRIVAGLDEKEAVWDSFVGSVKQNQEEVLIEDDPIVEAIESGFERGFLFEDTDYLARELYEAMSAALFGKDHPKAGWYKSVGSFSKRLTSLLPGLQSRYGLTGEKGTTKRASNRMVYRFSDTGKEDCILKGLIEVYDEREFEDSDVKKELGITKTKYEREHPKPYIFKGGMNA